jgi:hypothetical protein
MAFRRIRILVLLGLLAIVALVHFGEQYLVRSWRAPLQVAIVPINGDGSEAVSEYLNQLNVSAFENIDSFLEKQAGRYGLKLSGALDMRIAPEAHELPPAPPIGGNGLQVAWWSLKLRIWAWRQEKNGFLPHPAKVRLFLIYHEVEYDKELDHSLGLQKGLVGVVHVFASKEQEAQNNVVIAHELLHTLGATDKYDMSTNLPIYPTGYAEPGKQPVHPQYEAEIMGGRIPRSAEYAEMPKSLDQCVIGADTAHEINFSGAFYRQFSR